MKISGQQSAAELEAYLKSTSKELSKTSKDEGAGRGSSLSSSMSSGDNVDLSPRAKELQEASGAVQALPDIREAKVDDIKGRVDSGAYNVKGEAVAGSIVQSSILDKLL